MEMNFLQNEFTDRKVWFIRKLGHTFVNNLSRFFFKIVTKWLWQFMHREFHYCSNFRIFIFCNFSIPFNHFKWAASYNLRINNQYSVLLNKKDSDLIQDESLTSDFWREYLPLVLLNLRIQEMKKSLNYYLFLQHFFHSTFNNNSHCFQSKILQFASTKEESNGNQSQNSSIATSFDAPPPQPVVPSSAAVIGLWSWNQQHFVNVGVRVALVQWRRVEVRSWWNAVCLSCVMGTVGTQIVQEMLRTQSDLLLFGTTPSFLCAGLLRKCTQTMCLESMKGVWNWIRLTVLIAFW